MFTALLRSICAECAANIWADYVKEFSLTAFVQRWWIFKDEGVCGVGAVGWWLEWLHRNRLHQNPSDASFSYIWQCYHRNVRNGSLEVDLLSAGPVSESYISGIEAMEELSTWSSLCCWQITELKVWVLYKQKEKKCLVDKFWVNLIKSDSLFISFSGDTLSSSWLTDMELFRADPVFFFITLHRWLI